MKSHRGDCHLALASETPGAVAQPASTEGRYALRRGLGCWELIFDGRRAVLKDQVGLEYVAWLLRHPHADPIHGVMLTAAVRHRAPGTETAPVLMERSLGQDQLRQWRVWRGRQKALEHLLDDPDEPAPVKAEAEQELERVRLLLQQGCRQSEDAAGRMSRAVRKALTRLVADLERAQNSAGDPHLALRGFGSHLRRHLLEASTRYRGPGSSQGPDGLAGKFCYEPLAEIHWQF